MLNYDSPRTALLTCTYFWIRSALLRPHRALACNAREVSVLLHRCLLHDKQTQSLSAQHQLRESPGRWSTIIILIRPYCYFYDVFFFAFVILIHWFGAVCTVRHSASLLICEDSQCGQRVDHFLLAWEGERISPLDVCHVDKSVAGVERMNNPWSKDVYSTAWSWTAIFQLHLLCHGPADFFPPFFFLKQYSRCCLERHFF